VIEARPRRSAEVGVQTARANCRKRARAQQATVNVFDGLPNNNRRYP
jgi:hypothetical protein